MRCSPHPTHRARRRLSFPLLQNDLQLDTEYFLEDAAIDIARRPSPRFTKHNLRTAQEIIPSLDPEFGSDITHPNLLADAADPRVLVQIDWKLIGFRQRLRHQTGVDRGEHRSVRRGGVIQILHSPDGRCARHVLHDKPRIAWNILADKAREQTCISVMASARAITDDQTDGL